MANKIFVNDREVACKSASGKSTAAFPDACFSPPVPPPTGAPLPYPVTAFASDTTEGSKTVKITGKEVMLKNKSYFKKCTGDEAATQGLAKGVVTHALSGKVYFNSWSMDVKFEDENVVRHLDMTTHNHMSVPGDTPVWPYLDGSAIGADAACADDKAKERAACEPLEVKHGTGSLKIAETQNAQCKKPEGDKCQEARKCMLTPYKPDRCCDGQTGHHLVEVHGFCEPGDRDTPMPQFQGGGGKEAYSQKKAPCVCGSSPNSNWEEEHGDLHCVQGIKENYTIMTAAARQPPRSPDMAWTYGEARTAGVDAHAATFPNSGCSEACIKAQLDAYHEQVGAEDSTPLRTEQYGFGDPSKGSAKVDQLKRGQELIKNLAENRIGKMIGGIWKF